MAHADYDCCAICDNKMSYSPDASAKARLCASCAVEISAETGQKITSVKTLLEWMQSGKPGVADSLRKVGFLRCYYGNAVDDAASTIDPKMGERP